MGSEREPNPTSAQCSVGDPLGVIEECAKQIWKGRGAPAGTTWRDFLNEAEELLLAGKSTPADVGDPKQPPLSAPEVLPPEVWALRDQDQDPFAAAVAWGFNELLDEHEAFCFATLLGENEFRLVGGDYRACTDGEIIALLASLARDYDQEFVEQEGQGTLAAVSHQARCEYWRNMLTNWRAEDRPLNYHDRNTIDRLRDAIAKHPVIEAVRLKEEET